MYNLKIEQPWFQFITCWEKRKKDEPPEAVRSVDNAHNDWINCLDAVEGLVVTGSSDNMVKVWKAKSKDKSKDAVIPAMALEFELKGHGYPVVAVKYIVRTFVLYRGRFKCLSNSTHIQIFRL